MFCEDIISRFPSTNILSNTDYTLVISNIKQKPLRNRPTFNDNNG